MTMMDDFEVVGAPAGGSAPKADADFQTVYHPEHDYLATPAGEHFRMTPDKQVVPIDKGEYDAAMQGKSVADQFTRQRVARVNPALPDRQLKGGAADPDLDRKLAMEISKANPREPVTDPLHTFNVHADINPASPKLADATPQEKSEMHRRYLSMNLQAENRQLHEDVQKAAEGQPTANREAQGIIADVAAGQGDAGAAFSKPFHAVADPIREVFHPEDPQGMRDAMAEDYARTNPKKAAIAGAAGTVMEPAMMLATAASGGAAEIGMEALTAKYVAQGLSQEAAAQLATQSLAGKAVQTGTTAAMGAGVAQHQALTTRGEFAGAGETAQTVGAFLAMGPLGKATGALASKAPVVGQAIALAEKRLPMLTGISEGYAKSIAGMVEANTAMRAANGKETTQEDIFNDIAMAVAGHTGVGGPFGDVSAVRAKLTADNAALDPAAAQERQRWDDLAARDRANGQQIVQGFENTRDEARNQALADAQYRGAGQPVNQGGGYPEIHPDFEVVSSPERAADTSSAPPATPAAPAQKPQIAEFESPKNATPSAAPAPPARAMSDAAAQPKVATQLPAEAKSFNQLAKEKADAAPRGIEPPSPTLNQPTIPSESALSTSKTPKIRNSTGNVTSWREADLQAMKASEVASLANKLGIQPKAKAYNIEQILQQQKGPSHVEDVGQVSQSRNVTQSGQNQGGENRQRPQEETPPSAQAPAVQRVETTPEQQTVRVTPADGKPAYEGRVVRQRGEWVTLVDTEGKTRIAKASEVSKNTPAPAGGTSAAPGREGVAQGTKPSPTKQGQAKPTEIVPAKTTEALRKDDVKITGGQYSGSSGQLKSVDKVGNASIAFTDKNHVERTMIIPKGQWEKGAPSEAADLLNSIGQRGLSQGPPGAIQIGPVSVPTTSADFKSLWSNIVGSVRHLRERFSPIEGKFGSKIAKDFIKVAAAPTPEARTITASFARRAFSQAPDPAQAFSDFMDLGRYYRLRDLQARNPNGGVGTALPSLSPADVARLESDPHIQKGIALWNKEIAPMLTDIRTRNGMMMNPNATDPQKFPFFVNLPGEADGPMGTDTSVNPTKAFNMAATGNKQLLMDPTESMQAIIRGHLASDYKQNLVNTLKTRYSVPATTVVPSGRRSFTGTFQGKPIEVQPVDLAPSTSPTTDIHYLPAQLAHEYNNIRQERGQFDTLFDKAIQAGTKLAVIGDFSPHAARVVAHVAARMAQSGKNAAGVLPSWLGSNQAAIYRMTQMSKTPLGETMQLLIDRSGSDKGAGFDVKPGQSRLQQWLGKPHELLFNPDHGVDPMARRVIADAHLRTLLGNEAMDKVETDLNAGHTTIEDAAKNLEKKMSDKEFVGLGRKVNATMGFANKQSRSNVLNWASRVFPFISSESGMIPREIAKVSNLDIPATVKSFQRGDYKQALLQMGGQLATGAIGTYLAANGLNLLTSGHTIGQNEDGHKLDIQLADGWYLSNLDPTFARGMRLSGLKGAANDEGWMKSLMMEGMNEPLSMMAKTLQVAFTTMSYLAGHPSAPHLIENDNTKKIELMKTGMLEGINVPTVTETVKAWSKGKPIGPAMAKDALRTTTGLTVKEGQDPETLRKRKLQQMKSEIAARRPKTGK